MDPTEIEQQLGPLADMMNFSLSSLIAGILFGIIGYWLYRQGKKRQQIQLVVIAVILMIYPYFTPGPKTDWALGIVLCALAKYFWDS